MRSLLGALLLLSLFALSAFAVDRGNFKTCEQSGFCKRNRKLSNSPRIAPYNLLPETLQFTDTKITADILNTANNVLLTFELSVSQDNQAHFKINEKNPIKQRYEVEISVVKQPIPSKYQKLLSNDGKTVTITWDQNKLVMETTPFKMTFYVEKEEVLLVNSRGLMNFEHLRLKNTIENNSEGITDPVELEDLTQQQTQFEKEESYWEEEFKGHKDFKPHGPESVGLDFTFPKSKGVYGIPEHATSFSLKPTKGDGISSEPYRLYNLDVFEYELDVPMALYGAIPFMYSHRPDNSVGILWLNAAETWIDVEKPSNGIDTHWFSESGIMDVYIFLGPSPQKVFQQYSTLTGTTPLPPYFSIGYHQCRWNYIDEADVEKVDQGFDTNDIPYDVIWLDIEHTNGKRYFTWDSNKFPTPKKMQEMVATKGRKMVTIIDPHIKRDTGYHIHQEASAQALYVRNRDGGEFDGHCWPGSSSWVDFLDPKAREWWHQKISLQNYEGATRNLYTWNDMNEPSVFNGPEVTMHKHNTHYGGWEHRDVHNVYGLYNHMATSEGLQKRDNTRPFVLSRAFFAGSQRFGPIWTGDNTADWKHLEASVPMLLSLGIAGLPNAGADVGGFFGNPDSELLVRWFQLGAFQPFFRGHAHIDTKRREPWLKGEPYTTHIRKAIQTRYALLPFWYTLFHETSVNGNPIMRPLFVEYVDDEATFNMDDQYLLGKDILVKAVSNVGESTEVYLPGKSDVWYDFTTFQKHSGGSKITVSTPLDKIPIFTHGGSIIPKKERVRRSSQLMAKDPFTLLISLDLKKEATGDIYLDDGISYKYEKGDYCWRTFTFKNNVLKSQKANGSDGNLENNVQIERIVIIGYKPAPSKIENSKGESLVFSYDAELEKVVIKKPNVMIDKDWEITLQ